MRIEDVKTIGVLGLGTMGSGIAQVCATYGYKVVGRDISGEILERARDIIINGPFELFGLVGRLGRPERPEERRV